MEPAKTTYRVHRMDESQMETPYLLGLISELSEKVWDITSKYGWVACKYDKGDLEADITINYPDSYSSRIASAVKEVFKSRRLRFKLK
jgi:hypothetical protein